MAVARLISPFAQISGTISAPNAPPASSAVVAMPDRFGRTLLRSYVVPRNPETPAQVAARAHLTTTSEAAQTLSLPQVEAWDAIARNIVRTGALGLSFRLNWLSLFNQVNSYRLQDALPVVLNPPAFDGANLPAAINHVVSDDGNPTQQLDIVLGDPAGTVGSRVALRITRDLGSPTRQARDNEFRYATASAFSILPRVVPGNPNAVYVLQATTLNVLVGQYVGVSALILSPNGYPVGRTVRRNILVTSAW